MTDHDHPPKPIRLRYPKYKDLPTLSPRQRQVLEGYWLGESVEDTANRIGISLHTVSQSRQLARLKLRAKSMLMACKIALKYKLIGGG